MVKRIEKTYSVKDGQTTRTITLSAEEPLSSQSSESYSHSPHTSPYPSPPPCNLGMKSPTTRESSESYSSNTPVKYGYSDDDGPLFSQPGVSDSSNTPVKYGLFGDIVGALLGVNKEIGIDKICGVCDLMRAIGLASPTAEEPLSSQSPTSYSSNTPVGYNLLGGDIMPFSSQSPASYSADWDCRMECNDPLVACIKACNNQHCIRLCRSLDIPCMVSCLKKAAESNDAPTYYHSEMVF